MASFAATGFGMAALCIADERGYGKATDITSRARNTLGFPYQQMPNVHGFYYFVDLNAGLRWAKCE
jgi:hypothetical protein